ncbi:disease resistance protein RPV1-like [Syzygium oleosum]|uniref:disease resistance protein RPV1-like n=1 Tax=Syzygium oleosum TaxID=219896 RepID=UPI0024BB24C1|nr:disease resistance protein RPV1-like [Syzygium oleosum]
MAPATHISGMEFEVFLSFRGPDTRRNFTSCLYREMVEKGIRVFKDDKELRVGEKISGNLLQALDDTRIYIPIFSKGFASSPWCLREVAHMVDCISKSDGKKEILPVFFDVEPNDVKLKTELYKNALSEHEGKYGPEEVKRWADALVEVPTTVGWTLGEKEFGELIGSIVRDVQLKLKMKIRCLPDHLVKVDDEKVIEELLDVNPDDVFDQKKKRRKNPDGVRFIIIHGIGGIGKSTLAKVIFNKFLSKFSYSSFLEDVQGHRLLDMQKKLLSDTLGESSAYGIHDTNDGINRIRNGLSKKKVMVVVDNVNDKEQLKNLAGSYKWFGFGSRIIITVRDKRTIPYRTMPDEDNQTGSSYYRYHQVEEMPLDRAIMLFSKHAFRSDTPPKDWHNFSVEVVSSIGRLPLTLEVMGSLFANTDRSEWHETFKDLEQVPCEEVRKTLMISLNKLDLRKREIFLDIACFCIGEDTTHAYYMWDDCGYSPRRAIDDLLLMSLIKIDEYNKFWMHDEIRDLGRYIVKEENLGDARKRRWVWIDENTLDVLTSNEENPAVRALSLGISHDFTPKELARFPNLRFLGGERMNFVGNFKNLLPNLRWLSWRYCPENIRARNLQPVNLVVLNLSRSKITHKWGGWRQIQMVKKLKVLDLSWCPWLTATPDFSEFGKLEKLILTRCTKLSTIDSSIGKLKQLSALNFEGCSSLQGLPKEIGSLECLSEIFLCSTRKHFKFPETLGNLKSLTKFEIFHCRGINQLPQSIRKLTNLTHLILRECETLRELPDSLGELESLVELGIRRSFISTLPDSIGNLKRLKVIRMARSRIQAIPYALGQVVTLKVLDASCCWHIKDEIPWEKWSLTHLRTLDLYMTTISTLP